MCGRYTLKTPPDQWGQLLLPLCEDFGGTKDWQPRYNIAPTQDVLAVFNSPEGMRALDYFRWGLVPGWASDLSIGNRMINARSETLHEKRSFSKPLATKRCLIIADGYYEWQKQSDGTKQPCWIHPSDGGTMLLAGLWESNRRATDKTVRSCTIITTEANSALADIHDRMPVMLSDNLADRWLDSDCPVEEARSMLASADEEYFSVRQVSKTVNNPRNESPDCLVEQH